MIKSAAWIVFLFLFLFPNFSPAQAAAFQNLSVRLDRTATNAPLAGLVCARPSASGLTEAKVAITFPSDFTLSTNTASWTTGTSDLPSGSTAWTGIGGVAQSVSGQTVTFASGNLASSSTRYCFTFNASSSSTGGTGQKTGTLSTKDSGDTVLDTAPFTASITTNDQVQLNATVPAQPTDFIASLTSDVGSGTVVQGTIITYTLAYGSTLNHVANITIQADWSGGTLEGDSVPSLEILDYVVGSASEAYNDTPPVIDPMNRRITWTIPSFPASTTGTVTFKLQTRGTYHGPLPVSFTAAGRVLGPGTQTVDSTVTSYYRYAPGPTPTPLPRSVPPVVPTSPAPFFKFLGIGVRTVSDEEAQITVSTSQATSLVIRYGKSPSEMDETLTVAQMRLNHSVLLGPLERHTQYYFQVTGTNERGRSVTTDIFTFTTGEKADKPVLQYDTLIVTSNDTLVYNNFLASGMGNGKTIILPRLHSFTFQFRLSPYALIRDARLRMESQESLASNTQVKEAATQFTSLVELGSGMFTGKFDNFLPLGLYNLYLHVNDMTGNLFEEDVALVRIVPPFTTLSREDKIPVENARVRISLYNERLKLFQFLSPSVLPLKNPSYSNPDGTVPIVLPLGKYEAEVSAPGFKKQIVHFTLSESGEQYPTVLLTPDASILSYIEYFGGTAIDLFTQSRVNIQSLSASNRFVNFSAALSVMFLILLTLYAFIARIRIPLRSLPRFIRHHRALLKDSQAVTGLVLDAATKKPLSHAGVYLLDKETEHVLGHFTTTRTGEFPLTFCPAKHYSVSIMKDGYHVNVFDVNCAEQDTRAVFEVHQNEEKATKEELVRKAARNILSNSFEVLLVCSLLIELTLGISLGWTRVTPFLLLSIGNLGLYFLFLHHRFLHTNAK